MVRKFRHHERRLLKKVNFIEWPTDNPHESKVIRKYQLKDRSEYTYYKEIVALVKKIVKRILELNPNDPKRHEYQDLLTEKLYNIGLILNKSLAECEHLSVSSICRRRLAIILIKLKMAPRVSDATNMIEHGHIRIGPDVVTEPALLVTRSMEDFITWTDDSTYRRLILEYDDELDDYDLNN